MRPNVSLLTSTLPYFQRDDRLAYESDFFDHKFLTVNNNLRKVHLDALTPF